MTFAEYNTDTNFDNDKSSLEELVKIGLNEGKTSDEIKGSLSPKWQKSKKIGEFDSYVSKYSTPKAEEQKPTEEKVVETVTETSKPTEKAPVLDNGEEKYLKDQQKRADRAEADALNKIDSQSEYNWQKDFDTTSRMADAYKRIDDKMIEQLPTFMFKRYQNGEFGDPKSSDAKLRLAHFMINGLGTALSNMSHVIRKDGVQEQSDAEKYQQTNLEQGLQNRWNKYKQETQAAIDLATKEGMKEQDARLAVEQLTRDRNVNTVWNMMDSNQKLYAMEVTKKIGDYIGKMDISELGDFIAGAAYEGKMDKDKAVAIGIAKLAANAPDIIKNLPDGNIKDMVMGMIGGNPSFVGAGIGGSLLGGNSGTEGETGTTLEDGTKIDPGKYMNSKEYKELVAAGDKLSQQYYNGEIDEAKFRSEYAKLEKIMSEHGWFSFFRNKGIASADDLIKVNNRNNLIQLSNEFDELNNNAKNYTKDEYLKKYDELKARGVKWGISEKDLKSVEKAKDKALKKTKK